MMNEFVDAPAVMGFGTEAAGFVVLAGAGAADLDATIDGFGGLIEVNLLAAGSLAVDAGAAVA